MGRPPRFDGAKILDATARLVAHGGPQAATIEAIAGDLGAPTGSIYHRFASRDLLLAELWLGIVDRFQSGFLTELGAGPAGPAGLRAALYTPRWTRAHFTEARVLLLHRVEDFIAGGWPEEYAARADGLRKDIARGLRAFARRAARRTDAQTLRRVTFAVVDIPYATVRRPLAEGKRPSRAVDELVAQTYRTVMRRVKR